MKIAIIRYNAGNIQSVLYALERMNVEATVTADEEIIRSADKVIFPGVGEASTTMDYLKHHKLDKLIVDLKQPVLGICLGMQLMCSYSEEGDADCLGIFNQPVLKFNKTENYKIPHMGWNNIYDLKSNLFNKNIENKYVYFVHSFYVPKCENTIATCNYIEPFSAALNKNNFYATQFHPEKSGSIGEIILKNFIKL